MLINTEFKLTKEFMALCLESLSAIEKVRQANVMQIIKRLGMSREKFESNAQKIDKEYSTLLGLSGRMPLPTTLPLFKAQELKVSLQDRVMQLWSQNQRSTLSL